LLTASRISGLQGQQRRQHLSQLQRLAELAKRVKRNEASLLREALDDLLRKHHERLEALPPQEQT